LHVPVPVSELLSFAESDSVDDGGMVELVGDDCVIGTEKLLEDSGVCVKTTCVQNGVLAGMKI
jgi:hypothetical protein